MSDIPADIEEAGMVHTEDGKGRGEGARQKVRLRKAEDRGKARGEGGWRGEKGAIGVEDDDEHRG